MVVDIDKRLKLEKLGQELWQDFQRLASVRVNYDTKWDQIARRILPSHANSFFAHQSLVSPGTLRTEEMIDSTGATAVQRFAAIMESMNMPRSQTWHGLKADNPYLEKDYEVRKYFEEANRVLFKYRYAPFANFNMNAFSHNLSIGAFGNSAMFVDEFDPKSGTKGMRYKALHLGETFFRRNHQGIVDTIYRYFPLTKREAILEYGEDVLPDTITRNSNPDAQFFFLVCVKPREEYNPEGLTATDFPYAAYHVCEMEKKMIRESGFTSFPFWVSQYLLSPGEGYARGIAEEVLPSIKTLNEQKKTVLKQGHRAVDPTILAPDDGVLSSFTLGAGKINYGAVDANGRVLVHPLPVGNVNVGIEMMEMEKSDIKGGFFVDLFQILVESPQKTATEVLELAKEKGQLLAPAVGGLQSSFGQLIARELDIAAKQRLLPPMPPVLVEAQGEYQIVYDSPLTRAQRAEEAAGISRSIEEAIAIATNSQDPSVLDHFDWDKIIPEMAAIRGAPVRWMRAPDAIAMIRKQREAANAAEAENRAAPGMAAVVKSISQARKTA